MFNLELFKEHEESAVWARKQKLTTGEIYHICNRGVEGRAIFLDDPDYFRFMHGIYEFNDTANAINTRYSLSKQHKAGSLEKTPRQLLIKILAFSLMPNHYHLMVQ